MAWCASVVPPGSILLCSVRFDSDRFSTVPIGSIPMNSVLCDSIRLSSVRFDPVRISSVHVLRLNEIAITLCRVKTSLSPGVTPDLRNEVRGSVVLVREPPFFSSLFFCPPG